MADDLPNNETDFKQWLQANVSDLLISVGLAKGQTVLDYGCGAGDFAVSASKVVGNAGKVYGMDVDADALASLRKKIKRRGLKNVEAILLKKSACDIPLARESIDVILLYDVLHLVDAKRPLLKRLRKVLKPDGFLSVFPMHIGAEKMLQMAQEEGLFAFRDRKGMVLNFEAAGNSGAGTRQC